MNIQAYIPQGPLREFVDAIHFLSGKQIGTGVAFPRMHQVIIINLGTRFSTSDVYSSATINETDSAVWINGKQDDPFMLGNDGETAMYAIGLKLGMVPFLAGLPALETNNLAVGAENWEVGAENWADGDIFTLRERLLACPSVADGFVLIERYFTNLLEKRNDFSQLDRVKWLGRALYTHSVNQICTALGVTRKRLRNEALHYFGGSVKNIQGTIRLNRTLQKIAEEAANPHERPLSALHEYFDQSHFIHDFRSRTGLTPLQYRRLCRQFPFIARTPNFIALPRETFLQFISEQPR